MLVVSRNSWCIHAYPCISLILRHFTTICFAQLLLRNALSHIKECKSINLECVAMNPNHGGMPWTECLGCRHFCLVDGCCREHIARSSSSIHFYVAYFYLFLFFLSVKRCTAASPPTFPASIFYPFVMFFHAWLLYIALRIREFYQLCKTRLAQSVLLALGINGLAHGSHGNVTRCYMLLPSTRRIFCKMSCHVMSFNACFLPRVLHMDMY